MIILFSTAVSGWECSCETTSVEFLRLRSCRLSAQVWGPCYTTNVCSILRGTVWCLLEVFHRNLTECFQAVSGVLLILVVWELDKTFIMPNANDDWIHVELCELSEIVMYIMSNLQGALLTWHKNIVSAACSALHKTANAEKKYSSNDNEVSGAGKQSDQGCRPSKILTVKLADHFIQTLADWIRWRSTT